MTTIGASTTFSPSPLFTQEQAQLTQNPSEKNLPQNQEESLTSKIANGVATGLFILGCFAAYESGADLICYGAEYWQDRRIESNLKEVVFLAGTSIALSTLSVIASKTPKMIDAAKNLVFSNENQPAPTKSREEKTFPSKALLKAGLVLPGFFGLGGSMLDASIHIGRYMLGMCEKTVQNPYYNNNEPLTFNQCDHIRNDLEKFATMAITSIAMLTLGILSHKAFDRATSLKNRIEKVDLPAAVQKSESVKTASENEQKVQVN